MADEPDDVEGEWELNRLPHPWAEIKLGKVVAEAEDRYRRRIRALDVAVLVIVLAAFVGVITLFLVWQEYLR